MKLNKTDEKVVATLKTEGKELTLQELTDKTGEPTKKVFKSLKKLFQHEIVSTQARKYKLTGKMPTNKKGEDEEETEDLPAQNFFESLERALLPRPAAYKAAALLG